MKESGRHLRECPGVEGGRERGACVRSIPAWKEGGRGLCVILELREGGSFVLSLHCVRERDKERVG